MKKIICGILAICLAFSCCACSRGTDYSKYGDSAVLELENESAKPGKTVDVDVLLNNNPGTATVGVQLKYDASVLTPVDAKAAGSFKGEGFFSSNAGGEDEYGLYKDDDGASLKALWFNAYNTEENGKVMTITFEVAEDAPKGETAITFEPNADDLTNEAMEYVDTVYLDGVITIG